MLLLGVVVIVHGVALLTDVADRLDDVGGPLMIGYAVVMLLLQVLYGAGLLVGGGGSGLSGGMTGGMAGGEMVDGTGMSVTAGMGWNAGMVALALLMLVSGLVMIRDQPTEPGRKM
ncbi:hypothetical protein [Halopenitus sp. POP-27]|uniref:hypothetical protein n=1 Tax=Halopenitus sp. POP-27 TaxID=2994425 RepID=UPI002469208D|nr:hypothetical protein [Halopenitus sp. POP-27]